VCVRRMWPRLLMNGILCDFLIRCICCGYGLLWVLVFWKFHNNIDQGTMEKVNFLFYQLFDDIWYCVGLFGEGNFFSFSLISLELMP
jgi:hypothetical protein